MIRYCGILVTICMIALQSPLLLGQNIAFDHFTKEQGLSNDHISCLVQDQRGFLWIGTTNGLNRFDGYQFLVFTNSQQDSSSLSNNEINCIYEARDSTLWIGTRGGLNIFDPGTQKFQFISLDIELDDELNNNWIETIYEDKDGIMWIGTRAGLNALETDQRSFKFIEVPRDSDDPWFSVTSIIEVPNESNELIIGTSGMGAFRFMKEHSTFFPLPIQNLDLPAWIKDFHLDDQGSLWAVANSNKVYIYDSATQVLKEALQESYEPATTLQSILVTRDGHVIMGTEGQGLRILDVDINHLQDQDVRENAVSIYQNWITDILEDREGGLWVGTLSDGISRFSLASRNFNVYQHDPSNPASLSNDVITTVLTTSFGDLWLGTRRHGINILPRDSDDFVHLNAPANGMVSDEIIALFQDSKSRIWVGTWGKGLMVHDPEKNQFSSFQPIEDDPHSLSDFYVESICETRAGELWIATTTGISVLDLDHWQHGKFRNFRHDPENHHSLSYPRCTVIFEDSEGRIWVGTQAGGLNLFDKKIDGFHHYKHAPYDPKSLGSNKVADIIEDKQGRIWIATTGGLNLFDEEIDGFRHYDTNHGLPSGEILGMVEHKGSNIWISTGYGLSRFNYDSADFTNYFEHDGLASNILWKRAITISEESGRIICGSEQGLTIFHPDSLSTNDHVPPISILSMRKYHADTSTLSNFQEINLIGKKKISIRENKNSITLKFAALSYEKPIQNEYAYRLKGFSNDWINLGSQREVTITGLSAGNYLFEVRGCNADGIWNESGSSLQLIVTPPWYRSPFALFIWATLLLFIILYSIRMWISWRTRRIQRDFELEKEKLEKANLQQMDEMKSRFYANITHEFRTPLTVILGMSDLKVNQQAADNSFRFEMIHRNGENLLHLVDELLELSSLETNVVPLQLISGDLIAFVKRNIEPFLFVARDRNIDLTFQAQKEILPCRFDPDKLQKILNNLISNALKYTSEGGHISVNIFREIEEDRVVITVSDTGTGIPKEDIPKIFQRFYRGHDSATLEHVGNGIGLSLTRELIELMNGDITVTSDPAIGTTFRFWFPYDAIEAGKMKESPGAIINDALATEGMPTVLVIEDNADLSTYLKTCLTPHYKTTFAEDGRDGIRLAIELVPDIVISDVMLPGRSGFEICEFLKNHECTSHIPIVLLTARTDLDSRLEGLKQGADAYIGKPFELSELLIRLEKLLQLRATLQAYYADSAHSNNNVKKRGEESNPEDVFLQKVRRIIDMNLGDETFGLTRLCEALAMSRSQLFRKMKALTNEAPSIYIRDYRLQRGKHLLENTDLLVSDIAYQVGFKDPAYFSFTFHQVYGTSPSAMRKTES